MKTHLLIPVAYLLLGVLAPGLDAQEAGAIEKTVPGKQTAPAVKPPPALVAQLGHSDQSFIVALALSGDGKWLVTGDGNTARLWEVATGKEVRAFRDAFVLSLSADARWLVTGRNNVARLWEVATGKEIRTFRGHTGSVYDVCLSRDGKQLFTASDDQTARLWEVATGKQVRIFRGHTGPIYSLALSSDARWLVTGGKDKTARLWDTTTGKEVRAVRHADEIRTVSLSGDGKWLVTSDSKTARLWDTSTGKEERSCRAYAALSEDGKWLVAGDLSGVHVWDAATGKEVRSFRAPGAAFGLRLSKDARWLVTGGFRHDDEGGVRLFGGTPPAARLWEVATGKEVRVFQALSDQVTAVSLSRDGKWLLAQALERGALARLWEASTGKTVGLFKHSADGAAFEMSGNGKRLASAAADGSARLWEGATGREVRAFRGHAGTIHSVFLSGDGKWLVTGGQDKTARLWDTATGKEVRAYPHPAPVGSVLLSGTGKWLITTTKVVAGKDAADRILLGMLDPSFRLRGMQDAKKKQLRLWETATGKQMTAFEQLKDVWDMAVSGDDKWLVTTGNADKTVRLWETATGKEVRAFLHPAPVYSLSLSADGRWLATGSNGHPDYTARLWEAATGKEVRAFPVQPSIAGPVMSLTGDGKQLFTCGLDGLIHLYDTATGKELCRMIGFRDGAWAVVDSAGRFDAANGGDVDGAQWVDGMEVIALKQLKERYYEPGLLAKHMGFNKEPLREVAAFKSVKLFPTVEANPPDPASGKLTLKLANQGGGIGKVQVFVNGREFNADVRGPRFDADAPTATLELDLSAAVVKTGEKNNVRIVTWNAEGYLSSRGLNLNWEPAGRKRAEPLELYAIVAGISNYSADHLKLNFPAKDAEDMATALTTGGRRLFGADNVHLTLLCDWDHPKAILPTRANFVKAFEAARKARPGDVLVVYLAGHGIALQDKGQEIYCYLTREARTANRTSFADPAVREQSALTSAELTEWFKKIPALKQVLILDTCSAGAAASKLIEHRDVGADQIRAIDRLKDRTGFHVLMGCAADKVSYEASQYSQGVLTYALLQGMRGARLRLGEYVDVMDLFQYAADEVPLLAQNIGGIQKPLVLATRASSFDIGRLMEEDKKRIPLTLARPLLLRPVLQNADENVLDDDLKLVPLLSAKLRDKSYAATRGKAQAAVFVDADAMPGAVRPSGKYTVTGDMIRVRLVLRRDGQTLTSVQVDGTRGDLPGLVSRLVDAITEKVKKL